MHVQVVAVECSSSGHEVILGEFEWTNLQSHGGHGWDDPGRFVTILTERRRVWNCYVGFKNKPS